MIFTKSNRKKVCKRLIKKYSKLQEEMPSYGYGSSLKYYILIEYWESVLDKIQGGNNEQQ